MQSQASVCEIANNPRFSCSRHFRKQIDTTLWSVSPIALVLPSSIRVSLQGLVYHMFPGLDLYYTDSS